MHDTQEKELVLKSLSEKEEVMIKDLNTLKINDDKNEIKIGKIKEEIELLKEKRFH